MRLSARPRVAAVFTTLEAYGGERAAMAEPCKSPQQRAGVGGGRERPAVLSLPQPPWTPSFCAAVPAGQRRGRERGAGGTTVMHC